MNCTLQARGRAPSIAKTSFATIRTKVDRKRLSDARRRVTARPATSAQIKCSAVRDSRPTRPDTRSRRGPDQPSLGGRSARSLDRPSSMSTKATMRGLAKSGLPTSPMGRAANAAWQATVQHVPDRCPAARSSEHGAEPWLSWSACTAMSAGSTDAETSSEWCVADAADITV